MSHTVFQYYVLFPLVTKAALLLQPAPDGWSLPGWQTAEMIFWQSTDYVNHQIFE